MTFTLSTGLTLADSTRSLKSDLLAADADDPWLGLADGF